jgi:hypothetical protein
MSQLGLDLIPALLYSVQYWSPSCLFGLVWVPAAPFLPIVLVSFDHLIRNAAALCTENAVLSITLFVCLFGQFGYSQPHSPCPFVCLFIARGTHSPPVLISFMVCTRSSFGTICWCGCPRLCLGLTAWPGNGLSVLQVLKIVCLAVILVWFKLSH